MHKCVCESLSECVGECMYEEAAMALIEENQITVCMVVECTVLCCTVQ